MTGPPTIDWPGGRPPRPDGPITDPDAWRSADMADAEAWTYHLSAGDVSEIDDAVAHVKSRGLELSQVTAADFHLPVLAEAMEAFRDTVVDGRGFVLIRGLPVARYGLTDSATAYWGLCAHVGRAVPQNGRGHLLGHVRDIGGSIANPSQRAYMTRDPLPGHCDSADAVALLCLRPARTGGLSGICSSVALHNALLERRPDLLDLLFEPFYVDRRGEVPAGKLPFYPLPLYSWHGGRLTAFYQRMHIESAQRFPDVPRLTDRQWEALDVLDAMMLEEEFNLPMTFQPGDIQILTNHAIFHSRTEFEDWSEEDRKRHLLRLWMAPTVGRTLPAYFAERYATTTIGDRGGVRVAGVTPHITLDPYGDLGAAAAS